MYTNSRTTRVQKKRSLWAIKWFLTFYFMGFILYNSLPFIYVQKVSYSIEKPAPMPYYRVCNVVLNVKTVDNWYLGNPHKLSKLLKEKGLDASLDQKVEDGVSYRHIGFLKTLLYLLWDYLPRKLLGLEVPDAYSLYSGKCKPFLSDMPILFSFLNYDFPSYSFILGDRRNVFFSQDGDCLEPEGVYSVVSEKPVHTYAFSFNNFSFPGQKTPLGSYLVVKTNIKNTLILLYKDEKLFEAFSQNNIVERFTQEGVYDVYVYTYKFNVWNFYFGLRLNACASHFLVE